MSIITKSFDPFKLFYVNKKGKNLQNSTMPLPQNQKEGLSWTLRQESFVVTEGTLKKMGVENNIQFIALVLAKRELQDMVNEPDHESSSFPDTFAIFTMINGTIIICSIVAVIQWVSKASIDVCHFNINDLELLMEMGKISCYDAPQCLNITQIGEEAGEGEHVNKLINQGGGSSLVCNNWIEFIANLENKVFGLGVYLLLEKRVLLPVRRGYTEEFEFLRLEGYSIITGLTLFGLGTLGLH
ncbi:DNA repair protein RAD16 [Senna tora]|uniref:DNA repair protein RAD16 n=1 Tax=Senna tora TaxID=362788 RepID=A0A834W7V4_9FABA|nr:DNA repair protein RAD16 [Senna tora]